MSIPGDPFLRNHNNEHIVSLKYCFSSYAQSWKMCMIMGKWRDKCGLIGKLRVRKFGDQSEESQEENNDIQGNK